MTEYHNAIDYAGQGIPRTPKTSASSSPRRIIKSASPLKHAPSVGKLNFIQNDNIDEQFVHLFESHEDIKSILYSIEHQSKQTSLDLSQLFERSKSNNSHLNKLLDGISAYSREVTEEGGATKSDVLKLLSALEQTQFQIKESSYKLEKRQKDSLEQLTSFFEDTMNRQRKSGAYIDSSRLVSQHLDKEHSEQLEKRLLHVHELVRTSQEESLTELKKLMVQNGTTLKEGVIGELAKHIEHVVLVENASLKRHIDESSLKKYVQEISNKLDRLEVVTEAASAKLQTESEAFHSQVPSPMPQDDILALLAQKAELTRTNEALEKRNLELVNQHTKMETDLANLSNQYAQLRRSYSDLNDKYDTKLKLCERIRAEFSALQEEAQQFEARMKNLDMTKHDPTLHSKKGHKLRIATPLLDQKRVSSMPSQEARDRALHSNNSDIDE